MAGYRDLAARLAELAKVPSRVVKEAAAEISEQLSGQYDAGVNAYGNAWKPLLPQTVRRKRGDARILRRTDEMSAGTLARPMSGAGIEIVVPFPGEIHQTGTKNMVARKIMPDGSALPKPWSEAIARAHANAFGETMK